MILIRWFLLSLLVLGALPGLSFAAEDPAKPESKATPAQEAGGADAAAAQAALEKKFAEDMSGVVFAGSYSVTRDGKETPAEMEKYTILSVTKAKGDSWIFKARIQYGKHDLTIPMTLPVKWAGDTPVITLTDLTIPALGTFTSRVLIYGDRYSGTWQHGKIGGHLWGRIEKLDPQAAGDTASERGEKPNSK